MNKLHLLTVPLLACIGCSQMTTIIETESFGDYGGWVLNQQYMDQMGSPYLMAHGIGKPVEDAVQEFRIDNSDTYFIFARTFNWTSPWSEKPGAGQFEIIIDGTPLPEHLGATEKNWQWTTAGKIKLSQGSHTLALHDLTGFDGRCDAIAISNRKNANLDEYRQSIQKQLVDEGSYDFIVVGGGIAGMCAAVSAARLGLSTALIHDRSVLGGNNSSEVRVHTSGSMFLEPYPNLGLTMREFGHGPVINGDNDGTLYGDANKATFVTNEPNLKVFYNKHAIKVEKNGNQITSVFAEDTRTGIIHKFASPLFADCTGDGNLGFLAGADYRVGRESKEQTGERSAAKVADNQVLGASVLWNTIENEDADFPVFEYGLNFCDESVQPITNGEWTWETGMRRDQVAEAEYIRDYGMLVAYSNWSYLKNRYSEKDKFSSRKLNWVSYVAGKRESRRLLGDYILNQTDIESFNVYDDATLTISWPIDLHYPDPNNSKFFPGGEFLSVCNQDGTPLYPIPYRCFYSRNIDNLFMAGRDISVTHAALGTIRVMRTTCMMGEVVGMAAAVCNKYNCSPRGVYTDHLVDLKERMKEGVGDPLLPNNQNYYLGRSKFYKERFVSPDVE